MVISIIALLIGILLPALAAAREAAESVKSLSNLRQIGIGVAAYLVDHKSYYPMHSSASGTSPRTRWPDYLHYYMKNTDVYSSPRLSGDKATRFTKVFAHTVGQPEEITYGGYGYNFQYFGNTRTTPTFHARAGADIKASSQTVVIGDTAGSRKGDASATPGEGGAAVYVLDPPLGSVNLGSRGNGRGQSYYEGGSDEPTGTPETYAWRSYPEERNNGAANFVFADGHGDAMTLDEVDDFDGDGTKDNGYWNGRANANLR